jgi:hypothetical protein
MRIQAFVILLFTGTAAQAACEMPALAGAIPDGATATEQEMLRAQNEIRAYIASMDQYIACQNEEMNADEENSTADYLYLMSVRIESARAEVDKVAMDFNDQLDAYRAATQTTPIGR